MTILWLASAVAAVVTIILNAAHGFQAAERIEFAVLLMMLNAALDVAKCSLLPVASVLARHRQYLLAGACLILFPLLFVISVWNAVSQVAIRRDAGKSLTVARSSERQHLLEERRRTADKLAIMETAPTYAATSACALPKSADAKAFCSKVERATADVADLDRKLAPIPPNDPEPQLTLLMRLTAIDGGTLAFLLAVVPVLLAELVGSLGFVVAGAARAVTESPQEGRHRSRLGWVWRSFRNAPAAPPAPSETGSKASPGTDPTSPQQRIAWTTLG